MVFGLALVLALVLGVAGMAFGANGQNFILGKLNNAATSVTGLVGTVDGGAALRVTNPNSGTNDTALDLRVQAGEAPMRVNSAAKVANLNADKLDGLEPSQIKGAKAYAVVRPGSNPQFYAPQTSGFTAVQLLGPGDYCLTAPGLSDQSLPAVVSVDWLTTAAPEAAASAMVYTASCGTEPGNYRVITERVALNGSTLTDTPVNNVGFVIVVP
jgi:hypothetical protein